MYKPARTVSAARSCQESVGPYTRHIRDLGNLARTNGPPQHPPFPWGNRWGAAGLIVVASTAQSRSLVCLIDNDKTIGFPKGRAELGDASALGTALREWTEETGLLTTHLQVEAEPVVHSGPHGEVHYFAGLWDEIMSPTAWRVKDDPLDKSPITFAYWLPHDEVFQLQRLPAYRQEILRTALRRLRM